MFLDLLEVFLSVFAKQSYLTLLVPRMHAVLQFLRFSFYDPDSMLSIILWCLTLKMINSSHQCLVDSFDVTCSNTPCCTKVDILLYKMSMWSSLGSRTNPQFYRSLLSAQMQILRALCIYIIMFVFFLNVINLVLLFKIVSFEGGVGMYITEEKRVDVL